LAEVGAGRHRKVPGILDHLAFGSGDHAIQKLVDQSVGPFPIGSITFRGLAYEGLEFDAKLVNFRGTSSCDPGGENL
jgi:hypothetical protein